VPVVAAAAVEMPPILRGADLPPMPDVAEVPPYWLAVQQVAAGAAR
jgi:hypothetical protein